MNERQVAELISSTLVRARVPLGRAVGELRSIVRDQDAREHMPDLLYSWSRFVLGEVSEEDRARPDYYKWLNPRQEWALQYARSRGRVAIADMLRRWGAFSRETLRLDLAALVESGYLKPEGEKRGRFYQVVGNGRHADDRSSGNGERVSEGAVGASDDTLVDLKPLPEGVSQPVGKGAELSSMQHIILRTIARDGCRWYIDGQQRKHDAARPVGVVTVYRNGDTRFELDVWPEMRERVSGLVEAFAFELGRPVRIEQTEGRFFVVVGVSDGSR